MKRPTLRGLRNSIGFWVMGENYIADQVGAWAWAKANPIMGEVFAGARARHTPQGVGQLEQDPGKFLKSIGLFPTYSACVGAIATAGASAHLKLMRIKPDGTEEEVKTHPLVDLLGLGKPGKWPNPEQGFYEWWFSLVQQQLYTGETYFTAVGDPEELPFSNPEELWVLSSDHMEPQVSNGTIRAGKTDSTLIGYAFVGERVKREFSPEQVVMSRRVHPRDPLRGLSPMKELQSTLKWMFDAVESNKSYLQNNAEPGLTISSKVAPAEELRERLQNKFKEKMAGVGNAGRSLWLYGDELKVTRRTDSPKEARYMDVMHWARQEILSVMHCPPFVVGLLEHSNWSNSREQQQYFYRNAVMPTNQLLTDSMNTSQLVMAWGDDLRLVHDYSNIEALQPNKKEQAERLDRLTRAGIMAKNEARAELGLEPREGGEELTPTQSTDRANAELASAVATLVAAEEGNENGNHGA